MTISSIILATIRPSQARFSNVCHPAIGAALSDILPNIHFTNIFSTGIDCSNLYSSRRQQILYTVFQKNVILPRRATTKKICYKLSTGIMSHSSNPEMEAAL